MKQPKRHKSLRNRLWKPDGRTRKAIARGASIAGQPRESKPRQCKYCGASIYFRFIEGRWLPTSVSDRLLHDCRDQSAPRELKAKRIPIYNAKPAQERVVTVQVVNGMLREHPE